MNNEPNIEEIAEAITNRAFDDDFKWSGHDGAVIKLSRPNLMMVVEAAITEARASDAETIARLTKERDALRLCVAEVSDRDNALLALDATRKERDEAIAERDIEKRRRINYQGQVYRTATALDGGNIGNGFITTGDGDTPTTELQEAAQRMVAERDLWETRYNEQTQTALYTAKERDEQMAQARFAEAKVQEALDNITGEGEHLPSAWRVEQILRETLKRINRRAAIDTASEPTSK